MTTTLVTDEQDALGLRARWNRLAARLQDWIGHDLLALIARIAVAAIFFLCGRTKVDGWLSVNDTAYTLFREDYKVPILPPLKEVASERAPAAAS